MGMKDFFFSSFDFYFKVLVSKISGGYKDVPDRSLADDEFYYSMNRIYTKDKVKKMYFIKELPRLVNEGFIQDLKEEVDAEVYNLNTKNGMEGSCELVDIIKGEPYEINFRSLRGRSRLKVWERRYKEAMAKDADQNAIDEMLESKEETVTKSKNRWMIESFMYVKKIKDEEKGKFAKASIILELVADNDEILKECDKVVKGYMFQYDISRREVFLQTNEYYKAFSPVGAEDKNLLAKMQSTYVLPDEVMSKFDRPTYGKVGDDTGLYVGNDIHTGLPTFYNVLSGTDAQNIMICADTGGGKSNYIKGLYANLDLKGINTILLDYEGDEYNPIGKVYDAAFFKVSGEDSKYFNTIAIGDLTGIKEIDNDLKLEATKTTEKVFSLLLDYKNGMTSYERAIFSDLVNRVYEKFGVKEDKSTWYKSKDITYFHLYGELVEMSKLDGYIREYGQHLKDMVIKLKPYFEEGGINKSMFTNPLSLDEMLGVRHIVFSFGAQGKDQNMADETELALKQLFVGYITTLISNYNKSRGRLTAVMFEEVQRYLMHAHSGSLLTNVVTGGRKRGMITFLITNAPMQIVDKTDSTMDSSLRQYIEAIRGNLTGVVVGRLRDEHTERVAEFFGLENSLPSMLRINEGGNMKYSFLVSFKGESSVVKQIFHPDLLKTEIYATRKDADIKDYGGEDEDTLKDVVKTLDDER